MIGKMRRELKRKLDFALTSSVSLDGRAVELARNVEQCFLRIFLTTPFNLVVDLFVALRLRQVPVRYMVHVNGVLSLRHATLAVSCNSISMGLAKSDKLLFINKCRSKITDFLCFENIWFRFA